jgi:hypothetical protein
MPRWTIGRRRAVPVDAEELARLIAWRTGVNLGTVARVLHAQRDMFVRVVPRTAVLDSGDALAGFAREEGSDRHRR